MRLHRVGWLTVVTVTASAQIQVLVYKVQKVEKTERNVTLVQLAKQVFKVPWTVKHVPKVAMPENLRSKELYVEHAPQVGFNHKKTDQASPARNAQ